MTDWLTIPQACAHAHVSRTTLYRAIKAGDLDSHRLPNRRAVRIHRTALDAWIRNTQQAVPAVPTCPTCGTPTPVKAASSQ